MIKTIATSRYRHPVLGNIHVKVHGTARTIKARWVGQEVCVTVPAGCPYDYYLRFIDSVQAQLVAMRPQPAFHIGQTIDTPLVDFTIRYGDTDPRSDVRMEKRTTDPLRGKLANYTININRRLEGCDHTEAPIQEFMNRCVIKAAINAASTYIVPRARQLADHIGRRPLGWNVKETKHSLGKCSSTGIITLSPRLIFLPEDLADFVIYHELAHLSEMNHSAAFHDLRNRYCHGREAELHARVKAFRFPVF